MAGVSLSSLDAGSLILDKVSVGCFFSIVFSLQRRFLLLFHV